MIHQAGTRYFEVCPDDRSYPEQWFLDCPRTAEGYEIDARDFVSGCPYLGPVPALVPISKSGPRLAYNFAAFHMPVVTDEVARIISRVAADDVECFPVRIPGCTQQHFVLNATVSLDCLDEERSEFTRWVEADNRPDRLGQYHMISTIRIDWRRTRNHQIFRIKDWPIALLVSATLKNALMSVANLGVVFNNAS